MEIASLKKKEEEETQKQIDDIVNRSRRNNIIFKSIKTGGRDYVKTVKDFCVNILYSKQDMFINRAPVDPDDPLQSTSKDPLISLPRTEIFLLP